MGLDSQIIGYLSGSGYVKGLTGACFWSSFLLFQMREVRYLMAFWYMAFIRDLIVGYGMPLLLSLVIDCSCMAPRTPTMIVIIDSTFQPHCFRVSISGSYFLCLVSIVVFGN